MYKFKSFVSKILITGTTLSLILQAPISVNADEKKTSLETEIVESEYEKAFSRKTTDYTIYYMFDTDTKKVISFRSGATYIMAGTYSGKFDEIIKIKWNKDEWKEEMTTEEDGTIILLDGNEFEWEYKKCKVEKAQTALNKITETQKKEKKKTPSKVVRMAVNFPKRTADDISVSTVTDFTHTESDSVRLGNDEGVTITISSSTKKLTLDDLLIDYDDTLLNVDLVNESTEDKSGTIKLYATGIEEGSTEIDVYTFYDLLVKGDDAEGYLVPIKKLSSTEGQPAYVTPTGEKYHLSQDCAGENATRITVYEATSYDYKPCKNCVG